MILQRSQFVHQLPLSSGRILIVHAMSHVRLPADNEVGILLQYFDTAREVPEDCGALTKLIPYSLEAILAAIAGLVERQILTEKSSRQELEEVSRELAHTHGRDPAELLDAYRRKLKEGAAQYWSVGSSYGLNDFSKGETRFDVLLFGDCDIQMEADFLRREAKVWGIDLRVSATFPDDVRFASEHKHDAIIIGALRSRHTITEQHTESPHALYIAEAHRLLSALRERSSAPILIDNLPEPTVQPLGFAEQGLSGHRTRFRRANVTLSELAATIRDVYVVDIAATFAENGSLNWLDDGLFGFTHFGSPGWLLQRPEHEKKAVHNIFPDLKPLIESLGGDPYQREAALAVTHINALRVVMGLDRKKCIILDLDGTLWPGVLAETGSPFAWTPEISGTFSYVGLYFGLHEALLCLKRRGIVLACVSKNDEATVRELWKYPDNYPRDRLLSLDDFVTVRINWQDKVENIQSIADELGFALESFVFIDDHPVERDRVRKRLPTVEVLGEDPFRLRRILLTDPRLQLPTITEEAKARSQLVKSQLERKSFRETVLNEDQYIQSLNIQCRVERLTPHSDKLDRVVELFQRTTQFNTTGYKFNPSELVKLIADETGFILTTEVKDRFGDHGLVGAGVVSKGRILGLVLSCRVLGMGVEHSFLKALIAEVKKSGNSLEGEIIPSARNTPVRNIFRDNGFIEETPGKWVLS